MMDNLTAVIPFYNGHEEIGRLLASLPPDLPAIVVDDQSETPFACTLPNVTVMRPATKGYFTGAVNAGIEACQTDVLVLNQDAWLEGDEWQTLLAENRSQYALIGERIKGVHPAFPYGYVHGVFQFMRRDAIEAAGLMDAENYPLWGASAVWQWQICRKGFASLPVATVPGLRHDRRPDQAYGRSIRQLLADEPAKKEWMIRTPPMISVVIPAFNPGPYIDEAVASLIGGQTSLGHMPGQTFQGFEIIIVNDGSEGANTERMMALHDDWKGVKVIHCAKNEGSGAAMNAGVKAAIGRYICRLDADDMREPWSLADLLAASQATPHSVIYDDPVIVRGARRLNTMRLEAYDFDRMLERNMVHAGIMFEREAWAQVGGYRTEGAIRFGREDWAFNIALGAAGYCGVKLDRSGYLYRRHDTNRTNRNTGQEWMQRFRAQMVASFPRIYQGERPMGCCGKTPKKTASASQTTGPASAAAPQFDVEGMTLVEYVGANVGSAQWGGPGGSPTGRTYVFGRNARDQVKYVDHRDVEWLLSRQVDKRNIFQLVVVETHEEERPDNEEQPEEQTGTDGEEAPSIETPDPSTLTVAQITALDLTPDQWRLLYDAESNGRNRAGAIAAIKEHLTNDAS